MIKQASALTAVINLGEDGLTEDGVGVIANSLPRSAPAVKAAVWEMTVPYGPTHSHRVPRR